MYQAPDREFWKGKTDHEDHSKNLRWHQIIKPLKLTQDVNLAGLQKNVAFLGFCSDEGIRRIKGRVGAQQGPDSIRRAMASLPIHFDTEYLALFDAGNIICPNKNLETSQELLGQKVSYLLQHDYFPIILGGGHEVAYGHYQGLHQHLKGHPEASFGIINIDARLDLRSYTRDPNNETQFRQIADLRRNHDKAFHYLCLGIQQLSNTSVNFAAARQYNTRYIPAEEVRESNLDQVKKQLDDWIADKDWLYLTLDLGAISSASAPGVSSPSPFGLEPFVVREILIHLLHSKKLLSMDIAELSPALDDDNRTARLAAGLIFSVIQFLSMRPL